METGLPTEEWEEEMEEGHQVTSRGDSKPSKDRE
eukprot:CAMPEP_0168628214 /NCGR_PEP_ID=MMETSP0449_2-20121227/11722_1 /TAXON_ID=1082188 /ORGANISM="Strombidium rassoulzadegani, Strain ras09" /LENGTH=33 /DNA_ID= /DNA_START= /DNA_END= /DNA_ORIENTATION=